MSDAPTHPAPQILVVDDDPELITLITMLLRRIGATTHVAYDGSEALDLLARQVPDLIVLDLMMPDVSGYEVLEQLRQQPRFDHVPVLILSAKADPNSIRRGLGLGADGYVTKPYIANSLIDRVRLLLSTGRKQPTTEDLPPRRAG